jgi:hypothetical protein
VPATAHSSKVLPILCHRRRGNPQEVVDINEVTPSSQCLVEKFRVDIMKFIAPSKLVCAFLLFIFHDLLNAQSGGPIAISQQPTNTTVEEYHFASFSVTATVTGMPSAELHYQWQAESSPSSAAFTNISVATQASYTTPSLPPGSLSGLGFRVILSMPGSSLTSAVARITMVPDVTAPRILSVQGTWTLRQIIVAFSEPINTAEAINLLNYAVSGGFAVTNAEIDESETRVTLTLDRAQTSEATYELTVTSGDRSGNGVEEFIVSYFAMTDSGICAARILF